MEVKKLCVENSLIMKEVKRILDMQKDVSIYVRGSSMRPFLKEGDKVTLIPADEQCLRKGMIVLAQTAATEMVLHRIVHIRKDRICLAGDANARQRESVKKENVWGIVSDAYRQGEKVKLYSCRALVAVWLWNLMRPFRGGLLKAYDWWNRKRKDI